MNTVFILVYAYIIIFLNGHFVYMQLFVQLVAVYQEDTVMYLMNASEWTPITTYSNVNQCTNIILDARMDTKALFALNVLKKNHVVCEFMWWLYVFIYNNI